MSDPQSEPEDPGVERRRESDRVMLELGRLAAEAGERLARLDDHKEGLDGIKNELAESRTSVDHLARTLEGFVPRQEAFDVTTRLNRRRRAGIAWLIFAIAVGMFVTDFHTEKCGPGARTEKVMEAIIDHKVSSMDDFNRVVEESTPDEACDAMFPIHTHDPNNPWPSTANVVGMGIYALLALLLVVFVVNGFGLEPNVSMHAPLPPIPDDLYRRGETDSTTNHGKDGP